MPRREKEVVIGIRKRGGELRLVRVNAANSQAIREIVGENLSDDVDVIITDESPIYPFALNEKQKKAHKTICHKKEYVSGLVHTNTVESAFSLLKRGIMGTWHNV